MEAITRADLTWALQTIGARSAAYGLYDDYYRGRHQRVFDIASETHQRYFAQLLERTRENLCKPVVRCFAERLGIEGWEGAGADAAKGAARAARLSALANRVHTDALKVGDAYLLAWPDNEPKLWRQKASEFVTRPIEDDPSRIGLAAKVWQVTGGVRVNLYYEDRVERYVANTTANSGTPRANAFMEYDGDGADRLIRHSFGMVPAVRFAHDADSPDKPGTSINEDVVPLQDILNKSLADMLIASEFFALPMRVFTGVTLTRDPKTGKTQADEFDPRKDRHMFFGGTDTKAFTLPSGDIRQAIEITDAIAVKIARVSGVPMHYLTIGQGQFPSGEALRTAEARLVSKVDDLHDEWGPVWSDAMALLGIIEAEPVWLDPAHVTETERLERLASRKDLGVPWEETMKGLGYDDPEKLADLYRQKDDEAVTAGAAFGKAFDAE